MENKNILEISLNEHFCTIMPGKPPIKIYYFPQCNFCTLDKEIKRTLQHVNVKHFFSFELIIDTGHHCNLLNASISSHTCSKYLSKWHWSFHKLSPRVTGQSIFHLLKFSLTNPLNYFSCSVISVLYRGHELGFK